MHSLSLEQRCRFDNALYGSNRERQYAHRLDVCEGENRVIQLELCDF